MAWTLLRGVLLVAPRFKVGGRQLLKAFLRIFALRNFLEVSPDPLQLPDLRFRLLELLQELAVRRVLGLVLCWV